MPSQMKSFTQAKARPLPVILLADVSGSMQPEDKIGALNRSVKEMVETFSQESNVQVEIYVAIITFGGTAQIHIPLQPASKVQWLDLAANGGTPMGEAISLATKMIEDQQQIPSRAYRPTIVLVSDGQPTDSWQEPLAQLDSSARGAKADRMALGIGSDADEEMLKTFLKKTETPGKGGNRVFKANEARQIRTFFDFVTMSITSRSRSSNPNQPPSLEVTDLENLDI
ncbi:MAG: VWA domain-containing protein [Candidatus Brocadiae bacterium]|nr:VWA domain-containing protein [Candidatus Brocadiia bacterium]